MKKNRSMEWKFSEFSKFRESDKSVKHELGSIERSVSHVCLAGALVAFLSLILQIRTLLMAIISVTEFNENISLVIYM